MDNVTRPREQKRVYLVMIINMNLWESYEQLPSLTRITVTFSITFFLIGFVYWGNQWIKKHAVATSAGEHNSKLIEERSDGVFYIYIAYWRFIVVAAFLALMLYVLLPGFLNLYQDLSTDFWHHWSKDATLTLMVLIAVLIIIVCMVSVLLNGYKAVQLEIGKDYVRFRKNSGKAGILFSDKYITVKYDAISEINLHNVPIIGYMLRIKTNTQTYNIPLLLPLVDRIAGYRVLEQAMDNWRKNAGT